MSLAAYDEYDTRSRSIELFKNFEASVGRLLGISYYCSQLDCPHDARMMLPNFCAVSR